MPRLRATATALASVGAPAPLVSTARSASRPPVASSTTSTIFPLDVDHPVGAELGREPQPTRVAADAGHDHLGRARGLARDQAADPLLTRAWITTTSPIPTRVELRPLDPVAEREGERGMG